MASIRTSLLAILLLAGPAAAQERGDPARGEVLANENCADCHEIRKGHYDSPLFVAPPFEDIANARNMSEIALFPFFQTPHVSMPNLVVTPDEIRDLTAYIMTLRH